MTPPPNQKPRRPEGRGGPRRALTRADLPATFTPETVRALGFRAIRQLAKPDNGILTPDEQQEFNAVWRQVITDTSSRVQQALDRAERGGRDQADPDLRRSYLRAQQRLAEQARRTREAFPELDLPTAATEASPTGTGEPAVDDSSDESTDAEDVSVDSLTDDIEETTTTLELLDRIASIQQQLLDHQESQRLFDTRGYFFALLVSVAVIVAGVAPLVEATSHDRVLIAIWTLAACLTAGAVYAAVRAVQRRS